MKNKVKATAVMVTMIVVFIALFMMHRDAAGEDFIAKTQHKAEMISIPDGDVETSGEFSVPVFRGYAVIRDNPDRAAGFALARTLCIGEGVAVSHRCICTEESTAAGALRKYMEAGTFKEQVLKEVAMLNDGIDPPSYGRITDMGSYAYVDIKTHNWRNTTIRTRVYALNAADGKCLLSCVYDVEGIHDEFDMKKGRKQWERMTQTIEESGAAY